VESVGARPAKSDLVRQTVLAQVDRFTLAEVAALFPAASPQLVKKVLAEMKKTGKVRLVGRGRGAWWGVIR
jgi:predicted transcriptional regulator of viral defense system